MNIKKLNETPIDKCSGNVDGIIGPIDKCLTPIGIVTSVNGKTGEVNLSLGDFNNDVGFAYADEVVSNETFDEYKNIQNGINNDIYDSLEILDSDKADKTDLDKFNPTDNFKTVNGKF